MLNKSTSNKANLLKLVIILPLLAAFLWGFNVKEVVEYKTIPAKENTTESLEEPIIEAPISSGSVKEQIDEGASNVTKEIIEPNRENSKEYSKISQQATKSQDIASLEFKFMISANTSNAELDAIKKKLKEEHGVKMSYSVDRNSNNQITAITITYSSSRGSGNYAISEDGPIEDFYFYMDNEGRSGFISENVEEREEMREERRAQRMEQMVERKEEMKLRMEERRNEMEERREEMEERREEMKEHMAEQKDRLRAKYKAMHKDQLVHEDHEEHEDHEDHEERIISNYHSGTYASSHRGSNHAIIVDKDTNDAALAKMRTNLAKKGIKFNYSKVRRNSSGEITRIKIVVDNGKGSKTTTTTNTDDGEPIEDILIELQ